MKKVLLIGADGQLSFDLIKVFHQDQKYELIEVRHKDFDITNLQVCQQYINQIRPQIIINTAAYHNTKLCEENPEIAFSVNAIGAYNLSFAAAQVKAKIIFFSSDYIFDGSKKGFIEDDLPNPLNVYGVSKLAGEILTKSSNKNFYIIRTTGLYGQKVSGKGHNFVLMMLEKARRGEEIKVVNDQYCSPTYTVDLAEKIKELIDKNVPSDTYHLVNQGSLTWFEFAKEIFELKGLKVNLTPTITDINQDSIKRPKYSVLVNKNLEKVGIKPLRTWNEALKEFISQISHS